MTRDERLYLVAYDISDPKRWRSVYRTMLGFGEWLQLSVFQCRLSRLRHAELVAQLDEHIHHDEDHVVIIDLGPADRVAPKIESLGKRPFVAVQREAVIV